MAERLARWIIFSVLIALLPLVFKYLLEATRGTDVSIALVLSQGELLLISSAIAATAVGELIARGRDRAILKLIAGGGCMITVLLASLYYAAVATSPIARQAMVVRTSLWLFGFTVLASCSCIALAEEPKA